MACAALATTMPRTTQLAQLMPDSMTKVIDVETMQWPAHSPELKGVYTPTCIPANQELEHINPQKQGLAHVDSPPQRN